MIVKLLLLLCLIGLTLCDSPDVCSLPKDGGKCRGSFTKYYFDEATSSCETFNYGGCGGNSNNFATFEDCVNACNPDSAGDDCE